MIRTEMYWSRLRLEVNGHAGAGKKGHDIVCAAMSMITGALVGALEEAQQRGRVEFGYTEKDGQLIVWANPGMGSVGEIKAYFRMCIKGIRMLREEYPNYVEIKEVH